MTATLIISKRNHLKEDEGLVSLEVTTSLVGCDNDNAQPSKPGFREETLWDGDKDTVRSGDRSFHWLSCLFKT